MTFRVPREPSEKEREHIFNIFDYDAETGKLYKLKTKANIFKEVGAYNNGYLMSKVLGREMYNHHIAWYLHYKKWPTMQIDHIDRNRANNKINNLREADAIIQNRNHGKCKTKSINSSP